MFASSMFESQTLIITAMRILIVEDDAPTRALVGEILRQAGFLTLDFAEDGRQALEMVASNAPDLILLDVMLPELDGHQVCLAVRANPRLIDRPILVMTGLEDGNERARMFAEGATDVIRKPLDAREVRAKVQMHLQNRAMIGKLSRFQDRTARELAVAREMQEGLLPTAGELERIAAGYGIRIAGMIHPCDELAGDSWTVWPISATECGILVFDVVGHGTIAAINAFRIHILLQHLQSEWHDPGSLLAELNDRLKTLLMPGQFVTSFCAVIDIAGESLTYAAAGAPSPVLRASEASCVLLDGTGVPLGIVAGQTYANRMVAFPVGAKMMIVSDALCESALASGGVLGEERTNLLLIQAMEQPTAGKSLIHVYNWVTRTAAAQDDRAFAGYEAAPEKLADDLTLIAIERHENPHHVRVWAPAPGDINPRRVLVVDSDAAQSLLVQREAQRAGLIVDVTPDLAEAGVLLAKRTYHLVLVDLQQAQTGACGVLQPVSDNEARPELIVLGGFGTGLSHGAAGLAEALGLRISAVLAKPLRAEALRRVFDAAHRPAAVASAPGGILGGFSAPSYNPIRPHELVLGLELQEFSMVFQPEVWLASGQAMGIETFIRWVSGKFGSVPPRTFLPLAQQAGVTAPLMELILDQSLACCAQARKTHPEFTVSVNFSAEMLRLDDLLPRLLAALARASLPPEALRLEIAEADLPPCDVTLMQIRDHGIGLTIDDFGIGSTNLLRLFRLAPNRIKLDPSLVIRLAHDEIAVRFVRGLCITARGMKIALLAKGVECTANCEVLQSLGCVKGMGWHFGRAMPAGALQNWLGTKQS